MDMMWKVKYSETDLLTIEQILILHKEDSSRYIGLGSFSTESQVNNQYFNNIRSFWMN